MMGRYWSHRNTGLLYLSGDIDDEICSFLTRALYTFKIDQIRPVIMFNSGGGVEHCGFAMYDAIRLYAQESVGVVMGACASAALLPFLACDQRFMSDTSRLKIHHGTLEMPSTHQREAIVDLQELDKTDNLYLDIVSKRTGLNINTLKEHTKFGKYYDAKESVELGYAHGILTAPPPMPSSSTRTRRK